jgi:hypothetical protein
VSAGSRVDRDSEVTNVNKHSVEFFLSDHFLIQTLFFLVGDYKNDTAPASISTVYGTDVKDSDPPTISVPPLGTFQP